MSRAIFAKAVLVPYGPMATVRILHAAPPLPGAARRAGDDYGAKASPDWREIDWSPHLHDTTIAGRRVRYCDFGAGDGRPVVMIHGLGGSWQDWLENIPRIGKDRRVIALDLPGHGGSEMPVEKISISGFGRCVDSLCAQLGLGEVVLVGNSMGGFTAAEVAVQFPSRAAGLVLVSAAGITINSLHGSPILAGARLIALAFTSAAAQAAHTVTRRRVRPLMYGSFIRYPSRMPVDLLYEITHSAGGPGWMDSLDAITSYDFRERLPDTSCPTLVVGGAEDMLVPVRDADEFERLIPDARKVVFEDTGHVAMMERPRTFNDCVIQFIGERASSLGVEAAG